MTVRETSGLTLADGRSTNSPLFDFLKLGQLSAIHFWFIRLKRTFNRAIPPLPIAHATWLPRSCVGGVTGMVTN
jgi:hypothetical protein